MSNRNASERTPRILFLGMPGNFSSPILRALLAAEIDVCALLLPASPSFGKATPHIQLRRPVGRLPLSLFDSAASLLQSAWEHNIPVWEVTTLDKPEVQNLLQEYQPDLLAVACFPLRIPRNILAIPRLGCINVHPSLLPENRGPVPLFWTFRLNQQTTGVTIHYMEEQLDSGDILLQEPIAVPTGMRYPELERHCVVRGAQLLVQAINDIVGKRAQRRLQDETKMSYYPFPSEQDLHISAQEWKAEPLYRFIHGIGNWYGPLTVATEDKIFVTHDAIAYRLKDEALGDEQKDRYEISEEGVWIRCQDGWVHVRRY